MIQFRILHQDDAFVAIDKPAGFQVHAPEDPKRRISNDTNCLYLLRRQIEKYLYPVHRIDRATSGVVLYALTPDAAREISRQFQEKEVRKTYFAVTRGWTPAEGRIEHPLKSEHDEAVKKESLTSYARIGQLELPVPNGPHPTSRYSLVRAEPHSGRMHQLRRHFAHLSHPLIGDTVYGDGKHNRVFRELLDERALFLKAYSITFTHPVSGQKIAIHARWNHLWHRIFDLFGICPYSSSEPTSQTWIPCPRAKTTGRG